MRSSSSTSEMAANARLSAPAPARRGCNADSASPPDPCRKPRNAESAAASDGEDIARERLGSAPLGRRSLDAPLSAKPAAIGWTSATAPAVTPNSADAVLRRTAVARPRGAGARRKRGSGGNAESRSFVGPLGCAPAARGVARFSASGGPTSSSIACGGTLRGNVAAAVNSEPSSASDVRPVGAGDRCAAASDVLSASGKRSPDADDGRTPDARSVSALAVSGSMAAGTGGSTQPAARRNSRSSAGRSLACSAMRSAIVPVHDFDAVPFRIGRLGRREVRQQRIERRRGLFGDGGWKPAEPVGELHFAGA